MWVTPTSGSTSCGLPAANSADDICRVCAATTLSSASPCTSRSGRSSDAASSTSDVRVDSATAKRQLRFLLSYYRPYAGRMIASVLVMLPSSGITLLFPRLTGDLIDRITSAPTTNSLYEIGGIFLALLTVQAITGYIVNTTMSRTTVMPWRLDRVS